MAEYITAQPNAEARSNHALNKSTWFQLYPERLLLQLARIPDSSLRGDLLLVAITALLEGGLPKDADEVAFATGLSVERVQQLWPFLMRFQDKSEEWEGLIMPSFISAIIQEQREYREKFAAAGRAAQEKRKAKSGGDGDDTTPIKSTRKSTSTDAEASLNGAKKDSSSPSIAQRHSTTLNDAQHRSTKHDKHDKHDKQTKQKDKESADRAPGATAPTLSLVPSAPSLSSQISEIFEYWKVCLQHPNAKLTNERRRVVENRLKKDGYTIEQIKQAIDGCSRSVFHQGGNQHGTIYDDLSLICRDGTHLERFIAIAEGIGRSSESHVNSNKPAQSEPAPARTIAFQPDDLKPDSTVWGAVCEQIKAELNHISFATWFAPTRGIGMSGDDLIVQVPDSVFEDYILNNYREILEEALPETIAGIQFVTPAELAGINIEKPQIEEVAA